MVARVEDCFLGKEPAAGLQRWRWNQGVAQGDASSSYFDVSRSGALPTWTTTGKGAGSSSDGGDTGILNSFVSSYLMQQAASAALGRANTPLAPSAGAQPLARNPSFESINNTITTTTGSCSTPSLCVGSPVTVFPSRPSSELGTAIAAFPETRVVTQAQSQQQQLSDHYLSNDSLSYGSMNCVDDFWAASGEPLQLPPEFRFEPMLDDTADTGLSFSAGELDSLVSTNHGPSFCQSFFAVEPEQKPIKPTHLAIPARGSSLDHQRLRWSDEPWAPVSSNPPSESKSSPSSPTTPLDPHLFKPAAGNSNKRSFAVMSGEKVEPVNADKFDTAALSALLYCNTQSNGSYSSFNKDSRSTPPAPKQRRRHGTATDPQSIAARTRREKFTDRIRVLQSLVPNGERLDTVHMLSQTFEYVRFLQHKVWDLYNGKDSISEVKCEKWKEFVDTATGQVIV